MGAHVKPDTDDFFISISSPMEISKTTPKNISDAL